jgi:hypothetical protein
MLLHDLHQLFDISINPDDKVVHFGFESLTVPILPESIYVISGLGRRKQ